MQDPSSHHQRHRRGNTQTAEDDEHRRATNVIAQQPAAQRHQLLKRLATIRIAAQQHLASCRGEVAQEMCPWQKHACLMPSASADAASAAAVQLATPLLNFYLGSSGECLAPATGLCCNVPHCDKDAARRRQMSCPHTVRAVFASDEKVAPPRDPQRSTVVFHQITAHPRRLCL